MDRGTILIVDDDTRLRNLLGKFLEENNFKVCLAKDALEAKNILSQNSFDLIIVDVMMPNEDGITFTANFRQNTKTPIIILTARGDFDDRIKGLEAGADDYLSKPFEPKELLLRINNIFKRIDGYKNSENDCSFGEYIFDYKNLKLSKAGSFVYLTESEAKMLNILCQNKGKVVNREQFTKILGEVDDRSVDVQVTRLRKKIEENPKKPQFIQTIRNKGYKIC